MPGRASVCERRLTRKNCSHCIRLKQKRRHRIRAAMMYNRQGPPSGSYLNSSLLSSMQQMVRRSCRNASALAKDRLRVPSVSDEDILDVLRLWHFQSNMTRTNVFPEGASFVPKPPLEVRAHL